MSALYYVEVSARERTNIDLLWDVLAKSKSMRHWIEARELRNRRLGTAQAYSLRSFSFVLCSSSFFGLPCLTVARIALSPPEGTADDAPLLPSEDRSRCILS